MEISPETLHDLTSLQEQIAKENSAQENNLVFTFGTTFVLGGLYQNSYHTHSNLSNDPKLLGNLYDSASKAINEAFIKEKWYRDYKKSLKTLNDYEERIKDALILDLPCTTISWSKVTEAQKAHINPYAFGLTFLFCLGKGKSAIFHVRDPQSGEEVKFDLPEGTIVGGRFAESLHWLDPVEGEKFLYEVYFDNRILDKKYKRLVPEQSITK
jgi:hypothetical protein